MSINFESVLTGWKKPEEDPKEAVQNNLAEIEKFALEQITIHKRQIAQLEKILLMTEENLEQESLDNELKWYAARSEVYFLGAKKAINLTAKAEKKDADNKLETYGKWFDTRYTMSKAADTYTLILPPMISQYKLERRLQEGRAIYQMVLFLIKDYIAKEEGEIEAFDEATITFAHYIDKDNPESTVPDPDNIDIKKVIDAMHGLLIESDNLLHLSLYHDSCLASWPHTEVTVKKGKKVPQIF